MNKEEAVHPSGNLPDDDDSNIEDHETQHKRINQNNSFYTLVEIELQLGPQLEDQNRTNDQKTANKNEGESVMAYNNNTRSNILYPRIFYTLHIGPNDNGTGQLIFKLSTKYILPTLKYIPVPMPENLIEVINEMEDHFDNTQDDGQAQCDDVNNSEQESYN